MKRVTVVAIAALLLSCAANSAQAQSAKKVKITIPVIAHSMTPVFIAQNKVIFGDEKIDIDVTSTNGGGPDIRALIAGDVDFSFTTGDNVILAQQEGKEHDRAEEQHPEPAGDASVHQPLRAGIQGILFQ